MRTIFNLTNDEIIILGKWASFIPTDNGQIYYLRSEWAKAGGRFPVTEAQALFLKRTIRN